MTELKNTEQASPFSRAPQGGMRRCDRKLFEANMHVEALARLQLVIEHQEFGVLTGEVGSGKSTLVRHLVKTLDPMRYQLVYLNQAGMKPRDFYGELLRHMGEDPVFSLTKAKRLFEEVLTARAAQKDRSMVVVIDEAQDISPAMLMELRFALLCRARDYAEQVSAVGRYT